MGTKNIRIPDTLMELIRADWPPDEAPGPVLLKAYEQQRMLAALAKVLQDRGFSDGDTPLEIVRNYIAHADNTVLDLKDQIIKTQDERDQYENFFITLWEMFLKGDVLGIRTTLPGIVNGIQKKNGG